MNTMITIAQTIILWFLPFFQQNFNITPATNAISTTKVQFGQAHQHNCFIAHPFEATKAKVRNILVSDYSDTLRSFSFSGMGKMKTIVIDPGHGGHDPGCSGSNSREKHLALAVAKKLRSYIKANYPDLNVIMTRDKDVFIPLYERAKIANKADADLFISIHCNYFPAGSFVRGSETYVMGLHTAEHNLDVAKRENEAILLEADYEKNYDYDLNSPEGHIMLSMFQNVHLEQSILFAELVENSFSSNAKRKSRGVKQAGFVVLKETTMPSVLIETGFLSNYKEEQYLKTSAGQANIAKAVSIAFDEYKKIIENEVYMPVDYPTLEEETPVLAKKQETKKPINTSPKQLNNTTPKAVTAVIENPPAPMPVPPTIKSESKVDYSSPKNIPIAPPKNTVPVDSLKRMIKEANTTDKYQFFVQLAATPNPVDTKKGIWANIPYQLEIEIEGKLYKYRARNFESLDKAIEGKNLLKHLGFTDAFIVAYKNGEKVSIDKIK